MKIGLIERLHIWRYESASVTGFSGEEICRSGQRPHQLGIATRPGLRRKGGKPNEAAGFVA
jgi:hypothetical protein